MNLNLLTSMVHDYVNTAQNEPQAATAISYTISLTDTTFGVNCGSAVIPTSSCREGICTSTFITTSSSECHPSTDISVTIFTTNALGNGPHSDPTLISKILITRFWYVLSILILYTFRWNERFYRC